MTPKEFTSKYRSGDLAPFDAVATYSSLEHSGLGRYGDGLNPWGDLITMARAWCVLKDQGLLMIAVPACKKDIIFFNSDR